MQNIVQTVTLDPKAIHWTTVPPNRNTFIYMKLHSVQNTSKATFHNKHDLQYKEKTKDEETSDKQLSCCLKVLKEDLCVVHT